MSRCLVTDLQLWGWRWDCCVPLSGCLSLGGEQGRVRPFIWRFGEGCSVGQGVVAAIRPYTALGTRRSVTSGSVQTCPSNLRLPFLPSLALDIFFFVLFPPSLVLRLCIQDSSLPPPLSTPFACLVSHRLVTTSQSPSKRAEHCPHIMTVFSLSSRIIHPSAPRLARSSNTAQLPSIRGIRFWTWTRICIARAPYLTSRLPFTLHYDSLSLHATASFNASTIQPPCPHTIRPLYIQAEM